MEALLPRSCVDVASWSVACSADLSLRRRAQPWRWFEDNQFEESDQAVLFRSHLRLCVWGWWSFGFFNSLELGSGRVWRDEEPRKLSSSWSVTAGKYIM